MTSFSFTLSPAAYYMTGATMLFFLIQLYYIQIVYNRPLRFSRKTTPQNNLDANKPVSVVVYSHGDSEELKKNLPKILTQDYSNFEVIVVNDGSDADSEDVLKIFSAQYRNLYYTFVPVDTQYLSHKKLALTMGIKAAKNEIILFTEANCCPQSDRWIESMMKSYNNDQTDIVLGFCSYGAYKGFFQKLIAYNNLKEGIEYISSALVKRPYSGSGRNLSYRKSIFFAHKGYSKTLNLHGGADSLFINEVATAKNCNVEFSSDSIVRMDEIDNYYIYREKKTSEAATRHYFKGFASGFYDFGTVSFFMFLVCITMGVILGILTNRILIVLMGILLMARYICNIIVFNKNARILDQKPLKGWLFLTELILPLYNCYIRFYRMFNGKSDYTSKI